jgi:hypothetical protein
MNKSLPWIFAATTLIFAGLAWWQYTEADQAHRERELTLGTLNTVQTDLDNTRRALADEKEKRQSAPPLASNEPTPPPEEPGKEVEPQTDTPPPPQDGGRFRPNAAMRKMFQERQRSRLQQEYQALFTKLGIKPEDQQKFLDLLMKRRQAQGRRGFLEEFGVDAGSSAKTDAVDQEIKQLIGDTNYPQYQDYQNNLPYVRQVNQLREQLVNTPSPLQDYQVSQLQGIMQLARTQTGTPATPGATLTPEQRLQSTQAYQQEVLQRAQGILNPTQLDALKTSQQTRLAFLQAAVEGSRPNNPAPPASTSTPK